MHSIIARRVGAGVIMLPALCFYPALARADFIYSESAYLAALQPGFFTETFNGVSAGNVAPTINFNNSVSNFTATTNTSSMLGGVANSTGGIWLGYGTPDRTLEFTNFSNPITAAGSFFYSLPGGTVTIAVVDGNGTHLSNTVVSNTADPAAFIGWVGDSPITSYSYLVSPSASHVLAANDFTIGQSAVPEPGSFVLSGVVLLGWLGHRRVRRKTPQSEPL